MADFNFYLNRQGPIGQKGDRGAQGFSPQITVEKNTLIEYILRIKTQNSEFLTPNLRMDLEDRTGTYLRYDRETGKCYVGIADQASSEVSGEVRFATDEEITNLDEFTAVSPANVDDMIQAKGYLTGDNIIAGDNVTITKTDSGITIASVDGGLTEIPQATANVLGGIKANVKQAGDTQEVRIDAETGILYTAPGQPEIEEIDGGDVGDSDKISKLNAINISGDEAQTGDDAFVPEPAITIEDYTIESST